MLSSPFVTTDMEHFANCPNALTVWYVEVCSILQSSFSIPETQGLFDGATLARPYEAREIC